MATDPCPLIKYEKNTKNLKKREKFIYAPMSNFTNYIFDKDGDYITIPKG